MPTARGDANIGVINNKIYIMGGSGSSGPTALNEAYDPGSNTWQSKANLPTAANSGGNAVCNNKLYIIGGGISTTTVYNSNYVYTAENLYYIHCKQ